MSILPSQKQLPSFVCLDNTSANNKDILDYMINYKSGTNKESNFYNKTQFTVEATKSKLFENLLKKIEDIEIIQKNGECILRYCYNSDNGEKTILFEENKKPFDEINKTILVNYGSVDNYITRYNAFCDYDDFFTLLSVMIISGRIIGNLLYSYLASKYGSLLVFKFNLVFNLLLYVSVLIFNSSRAILYVFHLGTSLDLSLYLLVVAISTENIQEQNLSMLRNRISYLFSFSGLLSIFVMSQLADFRIILGIQITMIVIILNYTRTFLLENFSFLINNNLLDESYKNFLFLIHLVEINIEHNESLSKDICRIERILKNLNNKSEKEEKRSPNETDDFELKSSNKLHNNEHQEGNNKNQVYRKLTSCDIKSFRNNIKISNGDKNDNKFIFKNSDKKLNKSFSLKTVNNKIDKYFIDDKSFEIHNMPITKTVVNQSNNNITFRRTRKCKRVQFDYETHFFENTELKSYSKNTINNLIRQKENYFKKVMNLFFRRYMRPLHAIFSNNYHRKFVYKATPLYISVNLVFYGLFYKLENVIDNVYFSNLIFFCGELIGKVYSNTYAFNNSERKRVVLCALLTNSFLFFLSLFSDSYIFRAFVLFCSTFLITIIHEGINLLLTESFENDIRNNLIMSLSLSSNSSLILFILLINQSKNVVFVFFLLCVIAIFSLKIQRETYKKDTFIDNSLDMS